MHLREPGFTYSACGPFIKNKDRIQNCKETGNSRYIYQNACFQLDMIKDLFRRKASDKILCIKAFNIAKTPKYGYQRGLASMICNFLIKSLLLTQEQKLILNQILRTND